MSWLDKWGFLLGGSALVLSSEAPTIWKAVAKTAKWGFGDRIQVCDGTDDNIEIQAAINALSASGGKLILSEGNYSVSSVVQGISDLEIELLPGAKIALAVGATCRIFETTSTQNVSIHGGELEGTNNSTVSNELVYFRYCTGVHLGPIKLHDCYGNAFAVSGCEHVTLDVFTDTTRGVGHGGGLIEGCKYVSGVVHVKDTADSGADINGTAEYPSEHLNLTYLMENTGTVSGYGLDLYCEVRDARITVNVEGASMDNVHIHTGTFDGGVTYLSPRDITVHVVGSNAGRHGVCILGQDATHLPKDIVVYADSIRNSDDANIRIVYGEDIRLYVGELDTCGGRGISVQDVKGLVLSLGTVKNSGDAGVFLGGNVAPFVVTGGVCKNNGQDGGASYRHGIYVHTGSSGIIDGVRSYDDQGVKTQQYGIYLNGDYIICKNTDTRGNAVYGVYSAGQHNLIGLEVRSAILDLSGAAIDLEVFHAMSACQIVSYAILYTEASSADAGVAIRVGRYQDGVALDNDYFDLVTSEVSKNKGFSHYYPSYSLTNHAVAAGDTVTVGTAGGKTGTGEVMVIIQVAEISG